MKTLQYPPRRVATKPTCVAIAAALLLSGCAIGPDYKKPAPIASATQATWVAPLPHDGNLTSLSQWWSGWNDPVLTALIDQAQRENTSVATAAARIAQSRASYAQLVANLLPTFIGKASDSRSLNSTGQNQSGTQTGGASGVQNSTAPTRNRQVSLDASWELDVVGGARRARAAGRERLRARETGWHDARISIAAEVATQYVNLRACETLLQGYEIDTNSRAETARLTRLKERAGFEAPANAALTDASAAEARARLAQQKADCSITVKTLAELTAMPERELLAALAKSSARLPTPKGFAVSSVPAALIAQRPDVAIAEHDLIAANNDIGLAMADRFPRITLTGSIGYDNFSTAGFSSRGRTWNWGPQLSLPIFDAGRRAAVVDETRAGFDLALANYQAATLRAVREVEEALVRLDSAAARAQDANTALTGYQAFLKAADARVKAGGGNLTELEEARRAVVQAQGVAVGVARERLLAWVSLYKAAGGGWQESDTATSNRAKDNTKQATN
jgi:outer membrane protein, multidrug efflux system